MALVTREGERLYLKAWEYNVARILTRLAEIVTDKGGKVKPNHRAVISNRTLLEAVRTYEEKVELFTNVIEKDSTEARVATLNKYKAKLEEARNKLGEPITVTHTTDIRFILDDVCYYYHVSDNPFFPFIIIKTPVKKGKYSIDANGYEDPYTWADDRHLMCDLTEEDIKESAKQILDNLLKADMSKIRRNSTRKLVPNTYDGGSHYEVIMEPERFAVVDF